MGTTSLWLIIGLMMSQSISAASSIDIFDLPSGAGECSSYTSTLSTFIDDAETLNDGLKNAMKIVSSPSYSDEEGFADYWVARILFQSWFGITFGDNGEIDDSSGSWEILESTTSELTDFFDESGDLNAPVYPANLFCGGSMGDYFTWTATALDVNEKNVEVDGQGISIQTLYSDIYEKRATLSGSFGTTKPYYLSSLKRYLFLGDKINKDICSTTMNGGDMYGLTLPGYHGAETTTTLANDAEGAKEVTLKYDAMSEIVLICPNILTGTIFEYLTLADLTAATPIEPGSDTGMNTIVTSSSTMFHELVHLVTHWKGTGSDATVNPDFVGDFTYDIGEALLLAEGNLANPNNPDENYPAKNAVLNAQSYVFFAMAWYNWKNNPVSSDDSLSGAVYYVGLPEYWYWPKASADDAWALSGLASGDSGSDAASGSDSDY